MSGSIGAMPPRPRICSEFLHTGRQCPRPVPTGAPVDLCWRHLEQAARWMVDVTAPAGGLDRALTPLMCPGCLTMTITAVRGFHECWCFRCQRSWHATECENLTTAYKLAMVGAGKRLADAIVASDPSSRRRDVVYFVRFSDRIKIGTTGNASQRLENLPIDEVLGVFRGDRRTEQMLHRRFAAHRVIRPDGIGQTEWFQDHPDIRAFIQRCRDNEGLRRR